MGLQEYTKQPKETDSIDFLDILERIQSFELDVHIAPLPFQGCRERLIRVLVRRQLSSLEIKSFDEKVTTGDKVSWDILCE